MKRIFLSLLVISAILFPQFANAQAGIIPRTKLTTDQCQEFLKNTQRGTEEFDDKLKEGQTFLNDLLGCAIKTGRVSLWMMPYFITSLIRFLVALAGLICVLFIVLGGYKYVTGGISDDKESGKKTIIYAITGLVVVMAAWIIINVIQVQLTQ